MAHRSFRDLPEILAPGDLVVLNDTKVSALRVRGAKVTGAAIEALLLRPVGQGRYLAMLRPGRRLRVGSRIVFERGVQATVEQVEGDGLSVLGFDSGNVEEMLLQIGTTPLPPYIKTGSPEPGRYQTVYAAKAGSAAAPTAGLHFTTDLLKSLTDAGIGIARVTLDVGLDTFRPLQAVDGHVMHGERCELPPETAAAVADCRGRVFAVGTTTVRTLESFATGPRRLSWGEQTTKLFIKPGFEFRAVDGMLTNFHMPRTTMLVMLAAFAGRERVMRAYREALSEGYRFLSFGDAMLIY